jgi:hypothetical protein
MGARTTTGLLTSVLLVFVGSCRQDAGASCGSSTLQFDSLGPRGSTGKAAQPAKTRPGKGGAFEQPRVPLGVNLGGVNYYASALPFVDAMKMADPFLSTNAVFVAGDENPWDTEVADKIPRDAQGYPLQIPFTVPGVRAPQMLRASAAPAIYGGRYTVLYDGDGELEFPASPATVVSQAPGRIELDVQPAPERTIFVAIKRSTRGNHVRNVRLILPGFAQSYATQVFHPTFLARLQGVSTVRFMDWGQTNGSPLEHWQDRPTPGMSQGTRKGVALETMIDLANQAGTDAWFTVPHKADDRYVEEMAKLIKARLDPKRRIYVEYSNELWNSIFPQVGWSADKGCAQGLNKLGAYTGGCDDAGPRYWAGIKWQARRSGQIFRAFDKVFAGDSARLVRVLAGQAQNLHLNETLLASFENAAINPARGHADVLAIAPYAGGGVASDVVEAGEKDRVNPLALLDRVEKDIVPAVRETTRANKKLADEHGLGLVAYEAGQHLVAAGDAANDERFVQKLIEANRMPRMRAIYHRMFDAWYQNSGDGLLVLFNLAETPTKHGAWGLLENQEQRPESAPKYQAFLERLQALRTSAAKKSLQPTSKNNAADTPGRTSKQAVDPVQPSPAPPAAPSPH